MIEILPQSKDNILVVQASEKLTADDYEIIFIPELEKLIAQYGKISAVLYLDDNFHGWELGAMWDDAKFGLQHRDDFAKIAVVGGPAWIEWSTNIGAYFIDGQVQTFTGTQLQDAIAWIAE